MSIASTAPYSGDVEIWRKMRDTFNDFVEDVSDDEEYIGALIGAKYSHTISGAVVAPRTTDVILASPQNNKATYTGRTMYCNIYDDIESGDLVVYTDPSGKQQVFIVEGESVNDFVSPFSSFVGGKEVFLGRADTKNARYSDI